MFTFHLKGWKIASFDAKIVELIDEFLSPLFSGTVLCSEENMGNTWNWKFVENLNGISFFI